MTILPTWDSEPGEEGEPLGELVLQMRYWKPAKIIKEGASQNNTRKKVCAFPVKKSLTQKTFYLESPDCEH